MADTRRRNVNWSVAGADGVLYGTVMGGAFLAVLQDIREELQAIHALVGCSNAVAIPTTLREIRDRLGPLAPKHVCSCGRPSRSRRGARQHVQAQTRKGNVNHRIVT